MSAGDILAGTAAVCAAVLGIVNVARGKRELAIWQFIVSLYAFGTLGRP